MGFTDPVFYIVFIVCFAAWYAVPAKYRPVVLCLFNLIFYASWGIAALPLFVLTALMVWAAAKKTAATDGPEKKRLFVLVTAAVLAVPFLTKYVPWPRGISETVSLLRPAGVSFYSLMLIGYLADVYRGKYAPEKDFLRFFCFAGFFPVIVSGPVLRAETVLPVFDGERPPFDAARAGYGVRQIVTGLFKKIVLADALAVYADRIFSDVRSYTGLALPAAAVCFAIQLYCDFSGYSDIACGTGRLLGFDMPENFRAPYFSSSLRSFWRKWHISLTSWFRDYVYIPLGGNRKGKARRDLNMLAVFLLSGVWHGAGLNYLIWGGLHGAGRIAEERLFPKKEKKRNVIGIAAGFVLTNLFVLAAWVFFRAGSAADAVYVFRHMFDGIGAPASWVYRGYIDLGISVKTAVLIAVGLAVQTVTDLLRLKTDPLESCARLPRAVKWPLYVLFILMTVVLWASLASSNTSFIYAQF